MQLNGKTVYSPGQLLDMWQGTGKLELDLHDEAVGPGGDAMPAVDNYARMLAYGGLSATAAMLLKAGCTPQQAVPHLAKVREQIATEGPAVAKTEEHRARFKAAVVIMEQMIQEWERSACYEWSNDT
uniref:Uncharacterized protein n=1 Tax=Streptomyces sp. NBC_00003 TaxID=2903608 RepID=A0AAU2V6V2_9ACTN